MQNISNVNIVVITNITLEPFFDIYLNDAFKKEGLHVRFDSIPFNEYLLDNTDKIDCADQIIVWLNIDCFYPNFANDLIIGKTSAESIERDIQYKIKGLNAYIKQKRCAPVIWIGAEDYCYYPYTYLLGHSLINRGFIDRLNIALNETIDENDTYVDLKTTIAKLGIDRAYDNNSKYRWNTPYSRELLKEVANEVYKQYLIRSGITKKCVILDCDDVLWGGILSEDGIEGIQLGSSGLGRPYQDLGRLILNLYYHGIIIAICSKNDKSDVLRVFREHDGMILKEKHIAYFCVNWNNKADNIKTIAEKLNIGLDSMVFIDDSDFEIQAVKAQLPEVTAIKYEKDNFYEKLSCFNLKSNVDIEKVQQRSLTYQTNEERRKLKSAKSTFEDYLNALEMKVDFHEALPIEFTRIAELTQRTNKCTNGQRYTVSEIKKRLTSTKVKLYSVCVSDRFSNLGLVGAIEVEDDALTLFCLSCRALGRDIEKKMIDYLSDICQVRAIEFKTTGKNETLKVIFQKAFPSLSFI